MTGKHLWPRNPWGAPRGLPIITRWLTRRWHRRFAEAHHRGWDAGVEQARRALPPDLWQHPDI